MGPFNYYSFVSSFKFPHLPVLLHWYWVESTLLTTEPSGETRKAPRLELSIIFLLATLFRHPYQIFATPAGLFAAP